MNRRIITGANVLRSLLLFCVTLWLAGCIPAQPTPTPTPEPTAPRRIVQPVVVPTQVPPPSSTPAPTATETLEPTDVPPTATSIPPSPTAVPTEPPPTAQPTVAATVAPPTVPVAPPSSFAPTELIAIPEGFFRMGGKAENDDADEKPFHEFDMYAFSIEKLEVSNSQYQACVAAGVCAPPVKQSSYTRDSYFGNPEFANYPVLNVTWNDADTYCKWIGRRLPNEAEWERAAKGVENWRYTWSNSIGMHFEWNAIFHGSPISFCEASCPLPTYWTDVNDGFADTAPVGRFGEYDNSSGFGVIDMAGNVAEWTSNWYDAAAYSDGNDIYGPKEPTGTKVVRGGSWADEPRRNSDRDPIAPDQASDRIGFRCAQ